MHARRLAHCKIGRNARTHRIAHNIGALEIEMIEQRAHVAGHLVGVISGRIIKLARLAVPSIVERDDAALGPHQRADPAGIDPVDLFAGGKAVHQHNRLALTLVEIRDLDIAIFETCHDFLFAAAQPYHTPVMAA